MSTLPDLIASTHNELKRLSNAELTSHVKPSELPRPKRTVYPSHIISLEDGNKYKVLRRHLGRFNLTPDEYRAKVGLAPRLSDGRAKFRHRALCFGEEKWAWPPETETSGCRSGRHAIRAPAKAVIT